jgi:hypothetical protein
LFGLTELPILQRRVRAVQALLGKETRVATEVVSNQMAAVVVAQARLGRAEEPEASLLMVALARRLVFLDRL